MSFEQSTNSNQLISLAQQKCDYLNQLLKCINDFSNNLENINEHELSSYIKTQQEFTSVIDDIDKNYKQIIEAMPLNIKTVLFETLSGQKNNDNIDSWFFDLSVILKEQKVLLNKISEINSISLSKANVLSEQYKSNIKSINKQRLLISKYNQYNTTD